MTAAHARNERGAYAVLFAVLTSLLFAVAALGIDMGNTMARKSDVQGQADFAALAAGATMTSSPTSGRPSAGTLAVITKSLNDNYPLNRPCGTHCVTSAMLVDASMTNGDARFTADGLKVTAPNNWVDFGFARSMGYDGTDVSASATVGLFSPGYGPAPFYATAACGMGIQTLKDNSAGLSIPVTVPPLWDPAEGDTNVASGVTLSRGQVGWKQYGVPLTVKTTPSGSMTHMVKIGFFLSDRSAPVTVDIPLGSSQADIIIPNAVVDVQDLWYVRVFDGTKWSARSKATTLQVGAAVLSCDPGSSSGNFGTLDLPGWTGSQNDQIALNIAKGPKPPMSLAVYPDPKPTGTCPLGAAATVYQSGVPLPGTNCAVTKPGLSSGAVTDGYLSGVSGNLGRLIKTTSPPCRALGRASYRTIGSYHVNDDLLTCFMTDPHTPISEAIDPNYSGPPLFDASIYESPRFTWLPMFPRDPTGRSEVMPIIGMRPAFITDQPTAATKQNMLECNESPCATQNGLIFKNNSIRAIRVIIFDEDALPSQTDGHVTKYLGSGPRIVRLTD